MRCHFILVALLAAVLEGAWASRVKPGAAQNKRARAAAKAASQLQETSEAKAASQENSEAKAVTQEASESESEGSEWCLSHWHPTDPNQQRLTFSVREHCCIVTKLVKWPVLQEMCKWEFQREADYVSRWWGEGASELPDQWKSMLKEGQMVAGTRLASNWGVMHCHKQRATGWFTFDEADCKEGMIADIDMPSTSGGDTVKENFKLLWRTPPHVKESSAFIWEGLGTIFVAFGALRSDGIFSGGAQSFKVWWNSTTVEPFNLGHGVTVNVAAELRHKVDKLWDAREFYSWFKQIIAQYPEHRIMFTGVSYGGVMAKIASLRFKTQPEAGGRKVHTLAINAFRWTDAAGVKMFTEKMGDDFLQLQISRPTSSTLREWDVMAAWPEEMAKEPVTLLDQGTGIVLPCKGTCPGHQAVGYTWSRLMSALNGIDVVLPAMDTLMRTVLPASAAAAA